MRPEVMEKLKEDFSYLNKKEHFKEMKEEYDTLVVYFRKEDADVELIGSIDIPPDHKGVLSWDFEEETDFYYKKFTKIQGTPEWFQGIYREVHEKIEKRDRLLKLIEFQ